MNEQQKDSGLDGATDTFAAAPAEGQATEPSGGGMATAKPKRRSSGKPKAAPGVGDDPATPKKARSSTRGSKPKNVLDNEPPREDAPLVEAKGAAVRTEPDGLPPLPPAPVPTPEGIAFMQQHAVYQNTLEERARLRHERLTRSVETAKEGTQAVAGGQGASTSNSSKAKDSATGPRDDVTADATAPARKTATSRRGKAQVENSIEPGPEIRKEPASEAEKQVSKDAEDAGLLRKLLDRSRALLGPRTAAAAGERGAATAQSDVETLRTIKDAFARRLGLVVAERNRHAEPEYKKEFDKLAPDLKAAALAVGASSQAGASSPAIPNPLLEEKAKAMPTSVPESVRKRFLKVDSEYYFPDRSPAFVDQGAKLATRGEHPEVVVALIEIARERGWNSVTVKGTETFRRAAWMEAARNGLQVTGYKPSDLDLAQLNQREPKNLIEPGAVREHATAAPTSLEKPTDRSEGRAVSEKLEALAKDRPTLAVKKYPDLVQAYALLDAARKFAEAYMPGQEKQFVAIGKELVAQQIRDGKDVIGPKVHPEQMRQSRGGSQKSEPAIKSPEVQVRER